MSLAEISLSFPMWWINGVLAMSYWSMAHIPEFVALAAGAWMLFGIDPVIQQRAVERPRRQGRGEVMASAPTAQYLTLAAMLIWTVVSVRSSFPIPMIGAFLWWVGLLAVLAVPEERFNQLWWAKTGILVYACLVVLLRLGLDMLNQVSPADWAAVVGSRMDAQTVLATTRGNIATIGMLFVFVLYPLGYAGMLTNRLLRNPKPLFNLGLEAGEVIRRLRTRQ